MTITANRCARCGGPVYAHQRFCEQCGAPVGASPGAAAPVGQPGSVAPQRQSGMTGCCVAAVVGFLIVFCFGLALAALAAYLLSPSFSFGP
ncbi:MAG: hypothetical protein KatS3mg060_0202 [Dehalococcoidia bacterium]|nr:MAG: hypothetical protein KatS3mg060_0202 [Dehalococcoidia bacterium]